jgi:hypothetical protein
MGAMLYRSRGIDLLPRLSDFEDLIRGLRVFPIKKAIERQTDEVQA